MSAQKDKKEPVGLSMLDEDDEFEEFEAPGEFSQIHARRQSLAL